MGADLLHRKSSSFTQAHRELVKMLAAIAVEQYLAGVEAGAECADDAVQPHNEAAR